MRSPEIKVEAARHPIIAIMRQPEAGGVLSLKGAVGRHEAPASLPAPDTLVGKEAFS